MFKLQICFITAGLFVITAPSRAQAPKPTPSSPAQQLATEQITEYFRRHTERLANRSLADIRTLDDWKRARLQLREELLDMLGLNPLPQKTDLHATTTGTVEHENFIVEKIHFQSRPGLYVTGHFYRPKEVTRPLPTILYLCGHGNVKIEGVSYGSKTNYQHHPSWFVRQGYCSLIIDTLQLGEIEGLHHGTHREGMWWWLNRGYTPAGVEAWNSVRALDYLETRPEVDMQRIGVTGRSGGGAYSWWLAGIDDRPACFVPVAGITDLENHVVDDCIEGHCDCMFMVNTYGWDFATLAALAAPRPLLLSNTDKDRIFPLDGVVRTHAKLRRIYELHGAMDRLGLLITEGPHKDTQDLQVPAFRWMNRWLQNKPDEPVTRVADKPLDPKQLKVFTELPADQRNTTAHDWFVPRAEIPNPPTQREQWESMREHWITQLRNKAFRGWPDQPPSLDPKIVQAKESGTLKLEVIEFTSDENLRMPIYVLSGTKHVKPSLIVLTVVDQDEWNRWLASVAPGFTDAIPGAETVEPDAGRFEAIAKTLNQFDWAFATLPPRGVGPNQWNPDKREDVHIQRRFALVGKTADDGRVWDMCRAAEALRATSERGDSRLWFQGTGAAGTLALYAGIFTPSVERVDLHKPIASHRDGPYFLNIERLLDLPQAIALAFPRQVKLYDADPAAWSWTEAVARLYDSGKPVFEQRRTQSE